MVADDPSNPSGPSDPPGSSGGSSGPFGTSQEFAKFKDKLTKIEQHLQSMLSSTENDLAIAAELQKLLHKNRLPNVPGIQCLARYISAHQLSSEGFDLITTKKGREIWMIFSWTESFGLSSLLLQAMVHLQSKALIDAKTDVSPDEVFSDLSTSLTAAKKSAHYRLLVAKVDAAHLKVTGTSQGFAPFFKRSKEKNTFGEFTLCQPEAMEQNPALLEPGVSAAPASAAVAHHFHFSIPTGSRLYFLTSTFAEPNTLKDFKNAMGIFDTTPTSGQSSLVEDLNAILMKAEDYCAKGGTKADLTCVALEIDEKKLHLA